nr:hypothetical protein [uncultured Veillonella sp.]
MRLNKKLRQRVLVSGILLALLGSSSVFTTSIQAYGLSEIVVAKVLPVPSLPSISLNPLKMAGKILGLVKDSDKDVKNGKKVDSNYKFKATKVVNGSQTLKKRLTNSDSDKNVVLVQKKGKATLKGATIVKTGEASSLEKSLGRGQNAAVLVAPYSKAELKNTSITTSGTGASGLVASGKEAQIKGESVQIKTDGMYSRGINVAYKGAVTMKGGSIQTAGKYSPALAIDREEGTLKISQMNLVTTGAVSPLLYSTDEMNLIDVVGQSQSEILMLEGASEVQLKNSRFQGESGVVLYQSDLGLAKSGTSKLTIDGGSLVMKGTGALITVQNTKAQVNLSGVDIAMPKSQTLVSVSQGQWDSKRNSALVLKAVGENLTGHIVADRTSKVEVKLENSTLTGAINAGNEAKSVELYIGKGSTWNVTADSYVTKLANEDRTNSNIHTNGHTVVVDNTVLK